jgi:hypothetical protein
MDASDIPDGRETSRRFPTYKGRYLRVCRTQPGERSEHGMMEGMDRRSRPAGKLAGNRASLDLMSWAESSPIQPVHVRPGDEYTQKKTRSQCGNGSKCKPCSCCTLHVPVSPISDEQQETSGEYPQDNHL